MKRDLNDLKQDAINKLGLAGVQRRLMVREAVRNGWIDDPKKQKKSW